MTDFSKLRTFSIIAHIDHGKSTLADRFLQLTNTVPDRLLREQFLDQMDLERERGITIKLQPVRMEHKGHTLFLIDTPGHVDFTDEVSRSLAAVEGAILLVDATQGIQAQTMAHFRRAQAHGLTFIPVVNKIDLPNADPDRVVGDVARLVGVPESDVLRCSAKTGQGVAEILDAVIARVPAPQGNAAAPARGLIIDSLFDPYLGVVAYVRVLDGQFEKNKPVAFVGTRKSSTILDVGHFHPDRRSSKALTAGEIGFVVTGLKELASVRVGDTIARDLSQPPVASFKLSQPVVFAGIFPGEGEQFEKLRAAMEKLKLNDAALEFQPEHTKTLGYGFRCGFLGLLHLDVIRERLQREFNLSPTFSYPSVQYRCTVRGKGGKLETIDVKSPADFPGGDVLESVQEPWAVVDLLAPPSCLSQLLKIVREARGTITTTETFAADQMLLRADIPLASILVDFYDKVKSVSSGYASINVTLSDYKAADVVKLDVKLNSEAVESLAALVPKSEVQRRARQLVDRLAEVLPRQQFEIRIQAGVGSDILASNRVAPFRKDVIAGLYGGDVSRKMKLLKKQKKGKQRMRTQGSVKLSAEVVTALLQPDHDSQGR